MTRRRWLLLAPALLVPVVASPRSARAQTAAQVAALARAIPVQAGASIDRDSVAVGDVVRLTVRVRAPLGASVNFPTGLDSLGPVQSLESPLVHNAADSARAADRVATYRITPWDVGLLTITLGDVLVQTDEGERTIKLSLPSLMVRSVLPTDSTLRVAKPARPLIEPRAPIPWWWWVAAAVTALVLSFGAWWAARRRRGDETPISDPLADAETAFTRIERLGLVQAGEAGRHAALMTDVMRRYLAARVTGASLALTSGELLASLQEAPTVAPARLQRLLAIVDDVKFGAAPIGSDRARAVGDEAHAIVRDEYAEAARLAASAAANSATGQAAA